PDTQIWLATFVNGPVSENSRLLVWFDGHARFDDGASRLGTSILRPALGWRANDRLSLWAGYARVVGRRDNVPNTEENRIWQQATYRIAEPFGGVLSGRSRLEQRLLNTGDDTGWRYRQSFRFARPLPTLPYTAVVSNETFFHLNDADWGPRAGFDQTRTFIGAGRQITDNLRFEAGYLNVYLNRPPGADDLLIHAASLNAFVTF
ncbi:MAG: DUF2490 domain-containing protein, partial [Hyphococcus sp.]